MTTSEEWSLGLNISISLFFNPLIYCQCLRLAKLSQKIRGRRIYKVVHKRHYPSPYNEVDIGEKWIWRKKLRKSSNIPQITLQYPLISFIQKKKKKTKLVPVKQGTHRDPISYHIINSIWSILSYCYLEPKILVTSNALQWDTEDNENRKW